MEEETDKIFKDQLRKLPKEILNFILSASWDTDADEIGALYNLSEEELGTFKQEITLVLAGLVHPDEFGETLKEEVGITNRAILDAIVKSVEEKIFAPIRPALISFFESEALKDAEQAPTVTGEPSSIGTVFASTRSNPEPMDRHAGVPARDDDAMGPQSIDSQRQGGLLPVSPARVWEKEPDVVPDNLPVADEVEPLIPPIPEKISVGASLSAQTGEETPAHPFEEKMKQVFTAGQQSMGDLSIEPATSSSAVPSVPNVPPTPPIYHVDPYREAIE